MTLHSIVSSLLTSPLFWFVAAATLLWLLVIAAICAVLVPSPRRPRPPVTSSQDQLKVTLTADVDGYVEAIKKAVGR